jgi:drug/metabolite transporter (DMT)-like permease
MVAYLGLRGELPSLRTGRVPIRWLALGGGVNALALGLQLVAISSLVVSLFEAFKRAGGLLLAIALGAIFFGERLSPGKLAAGALMAVGVALVLF